MISPLPATPRLRERTGHAHPSPQPETSPTPGDQVELSGGQPPPDDPYCQLESLFKIPGYNFVFGHMASAVTHCARAWQWLHRKISGSPQPKPPQSPLPYLLASHPAARLERPVILVSGFNMKPDSYTHLTRKLTEDGANGANTYYVRDGQFFSDFECTTPCPVSPDASSRVFVASFHTTQDAPDQAAPQLDQDLRAIQKVTGAAKVDAMGYSMGGLATRVYLDQGGEAVGRFAMLSTPNQGSALAKMSHWLLEVDREGRDVDGILHWKGLRQEDVPALHWLRPTNGGSPNLHLLDLNSRWDSQRQRVEDATAIGSSAIGKTYSTYVWPVPGDGTVTASSLKLAGLPCQLISTPERGSHGEMPFNPQVYDSLHGFFHWG